MWAYYDAPEVSVTVGEFPLSRYQWDTKWVAFHACSHCACVMQHTSIDQQGKDKVGLNARMADPEMIADIPVRLFDGSDSWKFISG